uniref:Interferon/interleukin receptor domain-containing protein n=1 Tax=Mola mola TaxID=94237 RepID=A0A3Q3X319_MOLML
AAACVDLPAPCNVSISSFNMEHMLSFLPGPETPPSSRFTVEQSSWKSVAGCLRLTAGQTCNLTRAFRDPFDQYQARVRAFAPNRTSGWTLSRRFQPLTDTVLGPPDVSVSGCGNCLLLQLRPPATRQLQPLTGFHRELLVHVQRTRDGAQFSLRLPYQEEVGVAYLQPGVEYCLTVSIRTRFNYNSVTSKSHCAFTSPPQPASSPLVTVPLLAAPLAYFLLCGRTCGRAAPQLSDRASADPLLADHGPLQPPRNGSDQDEDARSHA